MITCIKCIHFYNKSDGTNLIWYNLYCKAPVIQRPKAKDPVTGQTGYKTKNSLGDEYYDDTPSPFCRDINQGNCPYFEEKK
jgi:hypothetical protein